MSKLNDFVEAHLIKPEICKCDKCGTVGYLSSGIKEGFIWISDDSQGVYSTFEAICKKNGFYLRMITGDPIHPGQRLYEIVKTGENNE